MSVSSSNSKVAELKIILREEAIPFFSDEEIIFYLEKNGNILENAAYECLIIKSENTTLNVSGMTSSDSSGYFRRLANNYKPSNTGVIK